MHSRPKTESELTREVHRALTSAGAKVIALVGGPMQEPGLPDRYVAHRRFKGFVEFKRGSSKLQTAQRICAVDLLARGVPCLVGRYFVGKESNAWRVKFHHPISDAVLGRSALVHVDCGTQIVDALEFAASEVLR